MVRHFVPVYCKENPERYSERVVEYDDGNLKGIA
jgi:hypothetical protein